MIKGGRAYRSTPLEATILTPNFLTTGREIRLPADLIFGHLDTVMHESEKLGDYVQHLKSKILRAHEIATKHLGAYARRKKATYDAKTPFVEYNAGDLICCLHETKN